jgi:hypothetical protein
MRKVATVKIDEEGRDRGKVFILTEMPASQAEKWATRAILALGRSGIDIGVLQHAGMAGIAVAGLRALAGIAFAEAEPLMDEMFRCIAIQPDPQRPDFARPLIEEDIEEVRTRARLRSEVFALHVGFSSADALWTSLKARSPSASATAPTSPAASPP